MKILNLFHACVLISLFFAMESCNTKKEAEAPAASGKPAASIPSVMGYIVRTAPFSEQIDLPGAVISNESANINPEISGRLIYLNITEGKLVPKGTLIAKIYDKELVAQLNKLTIQMKVQDETAKRYEQLLKINGVSQQEYDLIVLQSSNIRADMDIIRNSISRTEIRAPFTGILGLKLVSPGAYVTPQTQLTTIHQNDPLKLDFTIPEEFSSKLIIGQVVEFQAEGSNQIYTAKVMATEPDVSEETRSMKVRALIEKKDKVLLPGIFVKVKLTFNPDPLAIQIPSQAIIPLSKGKKVAIYRGGEVFFEDVETGQRNAEQVLITKGLNANDTIILTGLMGLKPGGKVKIGNFKN